MELWESVQQTLDFIEKTYQGKLEFRIFIF